ncbi:MAG: hypothetical protein IOD12_01260 [Silvanigrellales bacterium]|nr:hypothetical protein [Silvanigrellales bacterium]
MKFSQACSLFLVCGLFFACQKESQNSGASAQQAAPATDSGDPSLLKGPASVSTDRDKLVLNIKCNSENSKLSEEEQQDRRIALTEQAWAAAEKACTKAWYICRQTAKEDGVDLRRCGGSHWCNPVSVICSQSPRAA